MGFDDNINSCGTGLYLGLGFSSTANQRSRKPQGKGESLTFESSLTLSLSKDQIYDQKAVNHKVNISKASSKDIQYADLSCSYSHVSVKRETDVCTTNYYKETDADDDGSNGKKKLRLTKIQSALLEESFKQHSSLNPKQKQKLARELNVRPRQVEVWFQNRRARTKLKQTEVDCEFLKKYCETLTDENRKLYKELQELRKALKLAPQRLYMQLPTAAATLTTMCPSCERVVGNALPS